MADNEQTQSKPADEYVISVLTNLHDSLKWILTILMSGAAAQAAIQLFMSFENWHAGTPQAYGFIWALAVFLIFALTFLRFYWGAVRFFDFKYLEVPKFVFSLRDLLFDRRQDDRYRAAFNHAINSSTRGPIVIDAGSVFYQATFFFFLARSIDRPDRFVLIYASLLFFNSVYLFFTLNFSAHHRHALEVLFGQTDTATKVTWSSVVLACWKVVMTGNSGNPGSVDTISPLGAPQVWILNNLICGGLLVLALCMPDKEALFAVFSIIIMALNCAADIFLTHRIYIRGTDKVWRVCYDEIKKIPVMPAN